MRGSEGRRRLDREDRRVQRQDGGLDLKWRVSVDLRAEERVELGRETDEDR